MRTTSSNSDVVRKTGQVISSLKAKARTAKPVAKLSETESDEDDTLDREMAISSPVKGNDYRTSVQVGFSCSNNQY